MTFSKLKVGALVLTGLTLVPAVQANPLQGFYLGANLGGNIVSHDYSYTNGLNGFGAGELSARGRNSATSGSFGISGGYSHLITNCLMLGADLFLDGYFGGQSVSQNERITVKAKRNGPSYGFLVRAGVVAYPKVLAYVGVGGKFSKFTYKVIDITQNTPGTFPEASLTKRAFKPLVEVGLEGMFSNTHIGWRASYNCAFGRSANMGNSSFPVGHTLNQAGDNPSAKFSSTEHGIKLGAFYRF